MTVLTQALPPGTAFARFVAARGWNPKSSPQAAAPEAARRWPSTPNVGRALEMLSVGAGTSTGSGWADDLVHGSLAADLIDLVRPATVIDRLRPFMRSVPFNTLVGRVDTGTLGSWVGRGAPIPVASMVLDRVSLPRAANGTIIVLSSELMKDGQGIETLRQTVATGVTESLDRAFLDPDAAEVPDVSPASITNGATEVTSTGPGSDAIITDAAEMIEALGDRMVQPWWIMSRGTAVHIHVEQVKAGITPTITAAGGTFLGIPVLTTGSALFADSPGESVIALVDAAGLIVADPGIVRVAVSDDAAIQMDTVPTNNAATGTGAQLVSMFDVDCVGVRVVRDIYFLRGRDNAVVFMRVAY